MDEFPGVTHIAVTVPEQHAAAAGIIGPILFTAAFVVQGLLRPAYSPMADPISGLATRPGRPGANRPAHTNT